MYELSERELFEALHYAKNLDEETGAKIIEQLQLEKTALAETLFGMFPAFIAEQHQDMAYLFMNLSLMYCASFNRPSALCLLKAKWTWTGWKNRPCCSMLHYSY